MAAAFCALFAPGDGGVVMQPCAGSVLAAELSLGLESEPIGARSAEP